MKKFVFLALFALSLSCCVAPRVVERVEYRDRIVTDYQHDTLILRDSVAVDRGKDTLTITRIQTRDRVIYRDRVDSVRVVDSIPYEVQVVKEVRRRSGYDKFVSFGFWSLLAFIILCIVARVLWRVYVKK